MSNNKEEQMSNSGNNINFNGNKNNVAGRDMEMKGNNNRTWVGIFFIIVISGVAALALAFNAGIIKDQQGPKVTPIQTETNN